MTQSGSGWRRLVLVVLVAAILTALAMGLLRRQQLTRRPDAGGPVTPLFPFSTGIVPGMDEGVGSGASLTNSVGAESGTAPSSDSTPATTTNDARYVPNPLLATALGWLVAMRADDLTAPSEDATPVDFEVAQGESLPQVSDRLQAQGLIRNADAFGLLARLRGADRQVQAGRHVVRKNMSAEELLRALRVARDAAVMLTIPEGWRAEEVADLVAGKGLAGRNEFLALVGAGRFDFPAFADRPSGVGFEGYLFPDTYQFKPGTGAQGVLERLLMNFEDRFSPSMRTTAQLAGLSIYKVVTLASIVERESARPDERARIARVYLNRLAEAPYILNADPTVQYALGFQPERQSWWKRPLFELDLKVDSAYNTYQHPGLPPGPIASPGLAAIQAVLAPEPGDWRYFVANDVACDGSHVFATSYEEHLKNIQIYQKGGCVR